MAKDPIWWAGPICGLGNRMMALAAARASADGRPIRFTWSNDESCPGAFSDIFAPSPIFAPAESAPPGATVIHTGWEPYGIFETFKGALGLDISRAEFSRRLLAALDTSPFLEAHVRAARAWRAAEDAAAPLIGVHVRRTDRTEQHRRQFRDFLLRRSGLVREIPVWLSAFYGLAPDAWICRYENAMLTSAMRRFGEGKSSYAYAVFADDETEARNVEEAAARRAPKALKRKGPDREPLPQLQRLRRTSLSSAMTDLLCLAQCDAIAQSNRASTFSLVAAIIGRKPILTPKTLYPFWLTMEEDLGAAPNALPISR